VTAPHLDIQLFGRRDSRDTQKALRFFRERRVSVSFVDISVRPPAPAELRRFSQRLGASALLDREGSRYRDAGLAWLSLDDDQVLTRIQATPGLLKLPLVRNGNHVTIGFAEGAWKEWLRPVTTEG
jgi:arsenate reductase (glutaredoxin)